MGPLPQLYRYLVAGLALLVSLAGGVWLAGRLELPLGGFGIGLGAGCLIAFALVHDFRGERRTHTQRRR